MLAAVVTSNGHCSRSHRSTAHAPNAPRRAGAQGRTAALRRRLRQEAEFVFVDAPHELPALARVPALGEIAEQGGASPAQLAAGQQAQRAPKRAWLLAPEQHASLSRPRQHPQQPDPQQPDLLALMDEQQYQRQTAGWPESWACLAGALQEQGPFDGVLGLSQGAAVAAALCALQQEHEREETAVQQLLARKPLTGPQPALGSQAAGAAQLAGELQDGSAAPMPQQHQPPPVQPPPTPWFRFAILCSGYVPAVPEVLEQSAQQGGICLPSLHMYGAGGWACGWEVAGWGMCSALKVGPETVQAPAAPNSVPATRL